MAYRETRKLPFRDSFLQPSHAPSVLRENAKSLISHHTIGATTVGHDELVIGQRVKRLLDVTQRNRPCAWQVSMAILGLRPDINQDGISCLEAHLKFIDGHPLKLVAAVTVGVQYLFHLSQLLLGRRTHGVQEFTHDRRRHPVPSQFSFLFHFDKPGLPESLEVLRRIGNAHLCLSCQLLHGARGLDEQIQ